MKKVILAIICVLFITTGCSMLSKTPSDAVSKFLNKYKNNDTVVVNELNDYLSGEKQAFEYLYQKYKNRIQYFIYNIVRDYQKAEDLAQETFIYVMQNKMHDNISFKCFGIM